MSIWLAWENCVCFLFWVAWCVPYLFICCHNLPVNQQTQNMLSRVVFIRHHVNKTPQSRTWQWRQRLTVSSCLLSSVVCPSIAYLQKALISLSKLFFYGVLRPRKMPSRPMTDRGVPRKEKSRLAFIKFICYVLIVSTFDTRTSYKSLLETLF